MLTGRWRRCVAMVIREIRYGVLPRFAVDKLTEIENLFIENNVKVELDLQRFTDRLQRAVSGHYTRAQWKRLFDDIDIDRGGTVSWDEFTSFMIHQSMGTRNDYGRAKEFVAEAAPLSTQNGHKDAPKFLQSISRTKFYISGGNDGILRLWDSSMNFAKLINNNRLAASAELALHIGATPITDVVVLGSVCTVVAVDKCINLFNVDDMVLQRRYIGRNVINDILIPPTMQAGSAKPVDTVVLLGMTDALASCDVAQIADGREMFICGLMDGCVAMYPTMRHSLVAEVRPVIHLQVHDACVSKVRYARLLNAILSCSWDKSVCVLDLKGGAVTCRFPGIAASAVTAIGHSKACIDFAYHEHGRILATIAAGERDICLWNPQMQSPTARLSGHAALLASVTFNEEEYQLISLSVDNTIKIWDMRTYRIFQTISFLHPTLKMSAVHYDSSEQRLVGIAGVPFSWSIRRKQCGYPSSYSGHIEPLVGVLFVRELDVIVTSDICTTMVWNVHSGERELVFEPFLEQMQVSASSLDYSGRRLFLCTREGGIFVFNHRSGQLMREEKLDISGVLHAVSIHRLPNHVYLAFIAQKAIGILKEIHDNSYEHMYIRDLKGYLINCCVLGGKDAFGVPTIVAGTVEGAILIVSVTFLQIISVIDPPVHTDRDPLQDFVNSEALQTSVEGIAVLLHKSLMMSLLGDKGFHLWGMGSHVVHLLYVHLQPFDASILSIGCNPSESKLLLGDEAGAVHVIDITGVPSYRHHAQYKRCFFIHRLRIEAHSGPISRLVMMSSHHAFAAVGSDYRIKLWTTNSIYIGTFGEGCWTMPSIDDTYLPERLRGKASAARVDEHVHLEKEYDVDDGSQENIKSTQRASQGFAHSPLSHDFFVTQTTQAPSNTLPPLGKSGGNRIFQTDSIGDFLLRSRSQTPSSRSLTPLLGTRRRDKILRSDIVPAQRSVATPEPHSLLLTKPGDLNVGAFTLASVPQVDRVLSSSHSPKRWVHRLQTPKVSRNIVESRSLICTLRSAYEIVKGRELDWAHSTAPKDTCRAEMTHSETQLRIYDARQKNPKNWNDSSIASFITVVDVPASALELPPAFKSQYARRRLQQFGAQFN